MEIKALAPAKINRFIHITGRRPDGYHTIQSIFQLIGLYDELVFELSESKGCQIMSHADIPLKDNLIYRAFVSLRDHLPNHAGVNIHLTKNIPMGAGLGGGSSDAATTLLVLNAMFDCGLSQEQLIQIGAKLGADVPFFILGKNAWVEGIGDQIQPIVLPECVFLIAYPKCHVSTEAIYQEKALTRNHETITMDSFLSGHAVNDFEPVVRQKYQEVNLLLQHLSPYNGQLTGTGSACFAVFETIEQAKLAAQKLKNTSVFVVPSLTCSPTKHLT